jgi:hypothetical protein
MRNQRFAPLAVVEQVIFEVGVALDDPDVAQHLVEHARRTAGDALARSSSSIAQLSAPSRRMTISRSENEV